MEGYVPGEQPGEGEFLKLNTNENPYPPSDRVVAALRAACDRNLRRYPDPDAVAVLAKLSDRFGLPAEQIVMGNGSDELLNAALRCFAGPRQPVATGLAAIRRRCIPPTGDVVTFVRRGRLPSEHSPVSAQPRGRHGA